MKKFIYLLLIFVWALGACKPEAIRKNYEGKAKALKNGKAWKAMVRCGEDKNRPGTFSVQLVIFNKQYFQRESLGILFIPTQIGKTKIVRSEHLPDAMVGFYLLSDDGDVLSGVYRVIETEDNFVEITKFDKEKNKVEGNFQVSFVKDTTYTNDGADTIRFTEGSFCTELIE